MLQPQAVIFDIGNVLTRWQPEAFYDRVIGQERRRALFGEVDLHPGAGEVVDLALPWLESVQDQRFFAWPPEDDKDRPPYRGLLPLEAEDAGIFFGREAQTIEGLDRWVSDILNESRRLRDLDNKQRSTFADP